MNYNNIFVNRIGITPQSFMRTNKIVQVFKPCSFLKFDGGKLIESTNINLLDVNFKNHIKYETNSNTDINCIRIKGKFIKSFLEEKSPNNILGANDYFMTNDSNIIIPETKTTPSALETFGCKLIETNTGFSLNCDQELPLFEVSIGEEYVQEYLLQPGLGNGFYIEKHDTPHYHQPLDFNAGGFLILGQVIKDEIILTKFKIPFGCGIYTGPNVLHSDAYLVGNYHVVYTKTPNYSTYLFVNPANSIVNVQ